MRHFIDLVETNIFEDFNPEKAIERLRGVIGLIKRGATEGERSAAQAAFDRLLVIWTSNINDMKTNGASPTEIRRLESMLKSVIAVLKQTSENDYTKKKTTSLPEFKIGQLVVFNNNHNIVWKISLVTRDMNGFWEYSVYSITSKDKKTEIYKERDLRLASQDEIDAAMTKLKNLISAYRKAVFAAFRDAGSKQK